MSRLMPSDPASPKALPLCRAPVRRAPRTAPAPNRFERLVRRRARGVRFARRRVIALLTLSCYQALSRPDLVDARRQTWLSPVAIFWR
jgi:hypothetical protein